MLKDYIEGALWTVDWKNLELGSWGLKYLGVDAHIKWIKAIDTIHKLQTADVEKFEKENPDGTPEAYFKAKGVEGTETIGDFIKREIKKNPQKFRELIARVQKEQIAWNEEVKSTLAELKKENEQATNAAKAEKALQAKETKPKVDVEKIRREFQAHYTAQIEKFKRIEAKNAAQSTQ